MTQQEYQARIEHLEAEVEARDAALRSIQRRIEGLFGHRGDKLMIVVALETIRHVYRTAYEATE
ncbi:MAG: hypothetical protein ACLFVJ_16945 [Persicimonas sp.]